MLKFSFDPTLAAKEIEAKANAMYKEKMAETVDHAVRRYFNPPTQYNNFPGGEGYLLVRDMADSYLLADELRAKTERMALRSLEESILEVVQKAVAHKLGKAAFTTVREMAEKDPQALLQMIINHQPTQATNVE